MKNSSVNNAVSGDGEVAERTVGDRGVGTDALEGGAHGFVERFDIWFDRTSDRMNPILVKESRQALKSRQFAITFALLLIVALWWTFYAVAMRTPAIYYVPSGSYLMMGYFWILLFPLIVVVPFTAYRSLATEREDGTYELLTITSLHARKIVAGKLCSAILQMTVYLSALAPCIAFTYLLRGVDIGFILISIFGAFMVSILFSALGLVMATLVQARLLQGVASIVFVLGLAIAFFFVGGVFMPAVSYRGLFSVTTPDMLYGIGTFSTAWACLLALAFLAAAAKIQFLTDNRSTPLRIAMAVTMLCMIGWASWLGVAWSSTQDAAEVIVVFGLCFWGLMGSFMVGERSKLSPRIRRSLPKTFLGRVCLTWFQPGPGSGYFFALTNMLVCAFVAVGLSLRVGSTRDIEWTISAATVGSCYLAVYLGLGRILLRLLRRQQITGPFLSFLLHALLVALGVAVPLTVQYSMHGTLIDGSSYTSLQIPNPFWTFADGIRGGPKFQNGWQVTTVVLVEAAIVMIVVNFVLLAKDLMPVRESVPKRVAEDG